MKKKPIFLLIVISMIVVGFFMNPMKSKAQEMLDITPSVTITNLPKEVHVGDTGKFEYKFEDIQGVTATGKVKFSSGNEKIIQVDEAGNWKAVGIGETPVWTLIELSQQTMDDLKNKYPDHDLITLGIVQGFSVTVTGKFNPVYRLYNAHTGEHFYTESAKEKTGLVKAGWKYEGIGWEAPEVGEDVYRLYNPNNGDHHYTKSLSEKNNLKKAGWKYEGIAFYSLIEGTPVYRLYNPNTKLPGSHFYTTVPVERDQLIQKGWIDEGVAWYE